MSVFNTNVATDTNIIGDLTVSDDLTIGDTLTVEGNLALDGTLIIGGDLDMNSNNITNVGTVDFAIAPAVDNTETDMLMINAAGTIVQRAVAINPFDQTLNTTDAVEFDEVTITQLNVVSTNPQIYISDVAGRNDPNCQLHIADTKDVCIFLESDTNNVTETDNPYTVFTQDDNQAAMQIDINSSNTFGISFGYLGLGGRFVFKSIDVATNGTGFVPTLSGAVNILEMTRTDFEVHPRLILNTVAVNNANTNLLSIGADGIVDITAVTSLEPFDQTLNTNDDVEFVDLMLNDGQIFMESDKADVGTAATNSIIMQQDAGNDYFEITQDVVGTNVRFGNSITFTDYNVTTPNTGTPSGITFVANVLSITNTETNILNKLDMNNNDLVNVGAIDINVLDNNTAGFITMPSSLTMVGSGETLEVTAGNNLITQDGTIGLLRDYDYTQACIAFTFDLTGVNATESVASNFVSLMPGEPTYAGSMNFTTGLLTFPDLGGYYTLTLFINNASILNGADIYKFYCKEILSNDYILSSNISTNSEAAKTLKNIVSSPHVVMDTTLSYSFAGIRVTGSGNETFNIKCVVSRIK